MKAGVSVVSRGRRMDVCPAGSSLSCRMTLSGPGHGAGPEARVRGACYCLANRALGGHQSLRSPCPLSIRLGPASLAQTPSPTPPLGIKAREGSLQSLGYFCSNVQRFAFLE